MNETPDPSISSMDESVDTTVSSATATSSSVLSPSDRKISAPPVLDTPRDKDRTPFLSNNNHHQPQSTILEEDNTPLSQSTLSEADITGTYHCSNVFSLQIKLELLRVGWVSSPTQPIINVLVTSMISSYHTDPAVSCCFCER